MFSEQGAAASELTNRFGGEGMSGREAAIAPSLTADATRLIEPGRRWGYSSRSAAGPARATSRIDFGIEEVVAGENVVVAVIEAQPVADHRRERRWPQ